MKTLYLVRHAKSSWQNTTLSDEQRPLNKRGLRNAPEMGLRLNADNTNIDQIISSPANRAINTAKLLASGIGYDIKRIEQDDQLYFGGTSTILNLIHETGSDINSLMLVGHNPDMTMLLNRICGYQVDNMPTCAIAIVHLDCEWPEVNDDSGELHNFDFPKNNV
jgi:phosphohistidine phosphatase